MKKTGGALLALALLAGGVQAANGPSMAQLMEQLERLEQRDRERQQQLEALQQELREARQEQATLSERVVEERRPAAAAEEVVRGPQRDPLDRESYRMRARALGDGMVTSGTAFNPAISVIMDGVYAAQGRSEIASPDGFEGHDHGHGHGGHGGHGEIERGFNLRETEITFTASIDNYFDALVMLAVEGVSGVEVEEAYLVTNSLPAGWQVKFGRFLSDVGYINKQHLHDWDFADRPLVNEFLFGDHGLQENGVQVSWVLPTETYTRFGIEVLQGETHGVAQYEGNDDLTLVTLLPDFAIDPVTGEPMPVSSGPNRIRWRDDLGLRNKSGPRLFTGFVTFAPDLGFDHAIQFGASGGFSRAWQNVVTHSSGRVETWDGDAWFAGVDVVYKYDSGRSYGAGNVVLQGEYFYREIDADYASRTFADFSTLTPTAAGGVDDVFSGTAKQDGFYVQGLYGIAPRWQAGLRTEGLGLRNRTLEPDRANNAFERAGKSWRHSGVLTFRPTEFSMLRAQVNYSDFDTSDHGSVWSFLLQYNMSLGVHGAHSF